MGLGVLTKSLCFYQRPIADLLLTWKEIFKRTTVLHVAWERPTVIVGGAGFNEEEYKESEYRVKLYFLDGPDFYSEYIVYWFCIKSGQLLLCVTKIHKALLMQG